MPTFKTKYNPPEKSGVSFSLPSKTMQQFKDEADINILISRYKKTGEFYNPLSAQALARPSPSFGDFSDVPDIQARQNMISQATDAFNSLPEDQRALYGSVDAWLDSLSKSGVQGTQSPANAVNTTDSTAPETQTIQPAVAGDNSALPTAKK